MPRVQPTKSLLSRRSLAGRRESSDAPCVFRCSLPRDRFIEDRAALGLRGVAPDRNQAACCIRADLAIELGKLMDAITPLPNPKAQSWQQAFQHRRSEN